MTRPQAHDTIARELAELRRERETAEARDALRVHGVRLSPSTTEGN